MSDEPTTRILAAIERLSGDVTQLHGDVTQLRGDVTQLHGDVTQLHGDVTQLRGDVTQLRGDVTQLRGDVTQLRSDMIDRTDRLRVDTMARMDRLQNSLSTLRDEIVVNFGTAERIDRIARSAVEETRALADVVTAMQRQLHGLATRVTDIELRGNGHAEQH